MDIAPAPAVQAVYESAGRGIETIPISGHPSPQRVPPTSPQSVEAPKKQRVRALQLPHNPSNKARHRQKHLFRGMRLDLQGSKLVIVDTAADEVHAKRDLEDERCRPSRESRSCSWHNSSSQNIKFKQVATLRQNLPYDWYLENGLSGEQYILWYNFTIYEDGQLTKDKWEVDLDNPNPGEFTSTFHGKFNVADLRKEKYDTSSIKKVEYRRNGELVTSIEGLEVSAKVFEDNLYGVDVDSQGNPSYPGSKIGSSVLLRKIFSGHDVIYGSEYSDRLSGYGGKDSIYGGSGDDIIHGGQVENSEHAASDASSGDDNLYGNDGDDTISGGDRNDKLTGGFGKDILSGSTGSDNFIYSSITESGVESSMRDVITDFSAAQKDKVDLTAVDAYTKKSGNQAFSYIGSNEFTGTRGEVRFSEGILQMNIGTDKVVDMEIELTGVTTFSQIFLVL